MQASWGRISDCLIQEDPSARAANHKVGLVQNLLIRDAMRLGDDLDAAIKHLPGLARGEALQVRNDVEGGRFEIGG